MIIFKKPYVFIIIFIGIMLINVLTVVASCRSSSWTYNTPYSDCGCEEACYSYVSVYYTPISRCYSNRYGHWCRTEYERHEEVHSAGRACYGGNCYGHNYGCDTSCGGGGGDGGGGGGGPVIVPCNGCSKTYRFTKENWQAYDSCSGSRVPGSTTYSNDCSCQNLSLACYPNENYDDGLCYPSISNLQLFDSTGNKELTKRKTTQGEEFYMTLYQNFRIPGSQALIKYFATRSQSCSLNCEYLSLDYIQEGTGSPTLPYPCNTDANGNVSFILDKKYTYDTKGGSFFVSPKYRGLVKYNLTCYGPDGGPNCGHTDPYEATSTINLVLYDFTYREVSPNEIINYLRNQLASISQIINQNLNTLREIVKI